MLYRLRPPAILEWCDPGVPRIVEIARENPQFDLDALDWAPAESRRFSNDLLRVAVRYGVASRVGLFVDGVDAANVGHADTIRTQSISSEHAQADLHETSSMKALHAMFPGMAEANAELAERVRQSMEDAARRTEADLAEDLERPVQPELVEHWQRLGGSYSD